MPDSRIPSTSEVLELERLVLRAICASSTDAYTRQNLIANLAYYSWNDPDHRIVFGALARLRGRELDDARAALPAVATRMGFPDVNWDEYFSGDPAAAADALALARQLLAAASAGHDDASE